MAFCFNNSFKLNKQSIGVNSEKTNKIFQNIGVFAAKQTYDNQNQ